ncbi:hypothetical protein RYD26_06815 [Pasteurellaceae bacterium LIM206]|nr:hypothetical protein [Pasteurellaceae bacterium LIM206]
MNEQFKQQLEKLGKDQNRTYMYIIYALFALAIAFPPLAIFGVVFAFIKKDEWRGTIYKSHCDYLIKTFIVGFIGVFFAILPIIFWAIFAWYVYRVANGFNKLYSNSEVDGTSWFK